MGLFNALAKWIILFDERTRLKRKRVKRLPTGYSYYKSRPK